MMMKNSFGIFIVGPIIYELLRTVKSALDKNFRPLLYGLFFIIVFNVILFPYYYADIGNLKNLIWGQLVNEPSGAPLFSRANMSLFTAGLWDSQLSPPFFLLFVISLLYCFKRLNKTYKILFLLAVIVPNVTLYLMPHWKTSRYLLPQQPLLAVISAVWLRDIAKKHGVFFAVIPLLVVGLLQLADFQYGMIGLSRIEKFGLHYFNVGGTELSYVERGEKGRLLKDIKDTIDSETAKNSFKKEKKLEILIVQQYGFSWIDPLMENYLWFNNVAIESDNSCHFMRKLLRNGKFDNYDVIVHIIDNNTHKMNVRKSKEELFDLINNNWEYANSRSLQSPVKIKNYVEYERKFRSYIKKYEPVKQCFYGRDYNSFYLIRNKN